MSSINEISMVLCVRLHDGNPWVLERLEFLLSYYDPSPNVLVLDFGSQRHHAHAIRDICQRTGAVYVYHEDCDTYSAAIARNTAARHVSTEYIFFCDIDCVGEIDLFRRLEKIVSSIEDTKLNTYVFPVYHFGEDDTKELSSKFYSTLDFEKRIISLFSKKTRDPFHSDNSYVAPYSNVFLINSEIFRKCGGYDERFRGHGSEDFEFLLRLSIYLQIVPIPNHVEQDCFGPLTSEFFDVTSYHGFRKLFEAIAIPAELAGLRVGHLWHPRPIETAWHEENDSSRIMFNEIVSEYISSSNYRNNAPIQYTHDRSYIAYKARFYRQKEILYSITIHDDFETLEVAAEKELKNGNFGLALTLYQRSYENHPGRVTPLIMSHLCCFKMSRFGEALQHIRNASDLRPNSKRIRLKLALTKMFNMLSGAA